MRQRSLLLLRCEEHRTNMSQVYFVDVCPTLTVFAAKRHMAHFRFANESQVLVHACEYRTVLTRTRCQLPNSFCCFFVVRAASRELACVCRVAHILCGVVSRIVSVIKARRFSREGEGDSFRSSTQQCIFVRASGLNCFENCQCGSCQSLTTTTTLKVETSFSFLKVRLGI